MTAELVAAEDHGTVVHVAPPEEAVATETRLTFQLTGDRLSMT